MIDETLLKNEEKAVFALRSLYKKYGYAPFKMSKFEEYDLYVRNKDFLVSDNIITFNDTDGRLLALKPDVTLSIIKNGDDKKGQKQKVYYNENVYRSSGSTGQYREIMQTGVECIGDIDIYDIFEVISLAAQSLSLISDDFVLDISHLGILSSLLDGISDNKRFRKSITECVSKKSVHEISKICSAYEISKKDTNVLKTFSGLYGDVETVMLKLEKICESEKSKQAFAELGNLCSLLEICGVSDKIRLDFSVVNDMNYYSGIVFKGFLNGICESVLTGGRYDNLMRRMGRRSGAVGFAIYLDLLEDLQKKEKEYDVDTILLYDEKTDKRKVYETAGKLRSDGKSVSVQRTVPENIRYKEIIDLKKEENIND